jgi:hypothetical protein
MESKKWYMSKAIWAGLVAVLVSLYDAGQTALAAQCGIEGSFCLSLPDIPTWIYTFLAAFGVYGRGSATTRIE